MLDVFLLLRDIHCDNWHILYSWFHQMCSSLCVNILWCFWLIKYQYLIATFILIPDVLLDEYMLNTVLWDKLVAWITTSYMCEPIRVNRSNSFCYVASYKAMEQLDYVPFFLKETIINMIEFNYLAKDVFYFSSMD